MTEEITNDKNYEPSRALVIIQHNGKTLSYEGKFESATVSEEPYAFASDSAFIPLEIRHILTITMLGDVLVRESDMQ